MKISELINRLKEIQDKEGDLRVTTRDAEDDIPYELFDYEVDICEAEFEIYDFESKEPSLTITKENVVNIG